jgi:hypothetical protein
MLTAGHKRGKKKCGMRGPRETMNDNLYGFALALEAQKRAAGNPLSAGRP